MDVYQAFSIAREWIDNTIEQPSVLGHSQTRWLMDDLGKLCVHETIRHGEGEGQLCARLVSAWDIVHSIWFALAPSYATSFRSDEEEQDRIDKARHVIWHRRDPLKAYREGYNSPSQTSFHPEDFAQTVADYLEQSWLRHPFIDWVIVDATVSRELCSYGEELKKHWLPGRRDFVGMHHRYFKAAGNLEVMSKFDWNEAFERWNAWFWCGLGLPVGAIWAAFHFNYSDLGWWIAGIYVTIVLLALTLGVVRLLGRVLRWARGKPDPRERPFELWTEMYEVWRRLEGPVINPQRVRDAMQATTERGAVWDSATWSVIDRVIGIDPAVWVPHPQGR
ncbi:hypothetical protein [Sinorhizobium sp. CCBAU 05631]|uniref:hypothetical protein n=1 Tax=Sinorhizobium sp. CCBAU 05631 TaxID=794846 RepID=UPI0012F9375E|nr:hypothetical protein [Sinorhizobium sp. CCBAU 05631]